MRKYRAMMIVASSVMTLGLVGSGVAFAADNPNGERPGPTKTQTDKNRIDPSSAPDSRERGTTGTGNANGGPVNQDEADLKLPPKRGEDGVVRRPDGTPADRPVASPPPSKSMN